MFKHCVDSFATYKEYQVKEEQEVFGETEAALRCHICKHRKEKNIRYSNVLTSSSKLNNVPVFPKLVIVKSNICNAVQMLVLHNSAFYSIFTVFWNSMFLTLFFYTVLMPRSKRCKNPHSSHKAQKQKVRILIFPCPW